ncbi:general receptor for phosphoinositides 1-associated scaffold protein [Scleropages formosus]|uniref:Trafficking regulator and scaffold protein tamalin n=1 Tax=Scleropages formosus TaxID=113540 RepID=A0A8C9TDD8_SCLFO|nr:general receptor for phosphoinositides 1-associated scaffold protein [Scleropages formosus]
MKNMTFRRAKKGSPPESACGTSCSDSGDIYFPSSKSDSAVADAPAAAGCELYTYRSLAYSGGTLPRNHRKGLPQKGRPLTQSPEQKRKVIILEKAEEETFGFEIQTYGLHHQNENSVEMCTFVCKVHDNSPAQQAGLRVGDTIARVNEENVEGFRHKEIVQLIRSSGNSLRLETVYSNAIRKAELEARLQYLKQTLHEKWDEYRSLMIQEQRLVHGIVMSDAALCESLESARTLVYGSMGSSSPSVFRAIRCTGSASSSASYLSGVTDDDPLYQTLLYPGEQTDGKGRAAAEEQPHAQPLQRCSSSASDFSAPTKSHLTRSASTRSYLRGAPPSSTGEKQGSYSSLPRKPKQMSFRRRLLKFIPGLNRALEEEESKL